MLNFNHLFPLQHSYLLILTFVLALVSIFFSSKGKYGQAMAFLLLAGFTLRIFMAYLDPFLHSWDEKFHALVARNMMDHPLKPMLRVHLYLPYDYTSWCCNHIWLHKQPLFLWQMALSMKLFGVSEFTMRYPSVLMGTIMIWFVYRIALIMTKDKRTAFISAVMMCFCYYHLQFISGYVGMDHNDIAYDFYTLASIWAYAEYRRSQKIGWVILIGVLAGGAILNKWLTGLLVFAGWGINILFSIRDKKTRKELLHFFIAIIACVIVFLPWQLYILHRFPAEAKFEFNYNRLHILEAVEGHTGGIWYYFDFFFVYFGRYIWRLLLVGVILAAVLRKYHSKLTLALFVNMALVFVFFSFIVQTKLYNFFMVVVPIGYIFIAIAIAETLNLLKNKNYIYIPVIVTIALVMFNLPDVTEDHDPRNQANDWQTKTYNTRLFKHVRDYIPDNVHVVMNVNSFDDIDVMFYNKGIEAFSWCIDKESFEKYFADKHIPVAAFRSHNGYPVTPYVKDYAQTTIINKDLK